MTDVPTGIRWTRTGDGVMGTFIQITGGKQVETGNVKYTDEQAVRVASQILSLVSR